MQRRRAPCARTHFATAAHPHALHVPTALSTYRGTARGVPETSGAPPARRTALSAGRGTTRGVSITPGGSLQHPHGAIHMSPPPRNRSGPSRSARPFAAARDAINARGCVASTAERWREELNGRLQRCIGAPKPNVGPSPLRVVCPDPFHRRLGYSDAHVGELPLVSCHCVHGRPSALGARGCACTISVRALSAPTALRRVHAASVSSRNLSRLRSILCKYLYVPSRIMNINFFIVLPCVN